MAVTAYSEEQIRVDIQSYIQRWGGGYDAWYVGIAKDPAGRLFSEHGVNKQEDLWIWRPATSTSAARRIERYFVELLNTGGGPGGGDQESDCVYAYKKTRRTNP